MLCGCLGSLARLLGQVRLEVRISSWVVLLTCFLAQVGCGMFSIAACNCLASLASFPYWMGLEAILKILYRQGIRFAPPPSQPSDWKPKPGRTAIQIP